MNNVPLPKLPPKSVAPYRVSPDKSSWPNGLIPSLLLPVAGSVAVKWCRVVKVCAVARPAGVKARPTIHVVRRTSFLASVFMG